MENLIVVAYDTEHKAQETLNALRNLNDDRLVDLVDAVAVTRDVYGALNITDSYQMTSKEGAGWGVVWGTLIGGLLLAPFTGGLSAAAAAGTVAAGAVGGAALGAMTGAAGAAIYKDDFGLSEEFVAKVSMAIGVGDSAIFALADNRDPEQVANYFRGTGGTILSTSLTPQQQERVQQILAGKK